LQVASQQLHPQRLLKNNTFNSSNKSRTGVRCGLQHGSSQLGSHVGAQHAFSQHPFSRHGFKLANILQIIGQWHVLPQQSGSQHVAGAHVLQAGVHAPQSSHECAANESNPNNRAANSPANA
jgi:hypothetical protein